MSTLEMNKEVLEKITELYASVFEHDGYGEIKVEMKILRRGQKEVIIHCGKQYRYIVDFKNSKPMGTNINQLNSTDNSVIENAKMA